MSVSLQALAFLPKKAVLGGMSLHVEDRVTVFIALSGKLLAVAF